MITAFKKPCSCEFAKGEIAAITGVIKLRETREIDGRTTYFYEWVPGPSCYVCGTAWEETKESAQRIQTAQVTTIQ